VKRRGDDTKYVAKVLLLQKLPLCFLSMFLKNHNIMILLDDKYLLRLRILKE
jgi:hypothetical protein